MAVSPPSPLNKVNTHTISVQNEIAEQNHLHTVVQCGTGQPEVNRLAIFDCLIFRDQKVSVFIKTKC